MRISLRKTKEVAITFKMPLVILLGILLSLVLKNLFQRPSLSDYIILGIVVVGSFKLFKSNLISLIHKKFALDYIALLAIIVAVGSRQYLVAAIIVLMLSGGTTLEEYGTTKAKQSLTALTDRIPNTVSLWQNGTVIRVVRNDLVKIGQEILVRKGEVIPLDGILTSDKGLADESSLTGEPYMIEKIGGDEIRSGTINRGELMVIKVTKIDKDSTYRKIIKMVQDAQSQKAPLIRLANRYSTLFTLITLVIAAGSYFIFHDFSRVLSVLVIATPCPLILATPIALMGGMNAAAKKRIIMKKLSSIEIMSKVDSIIFDKTGTITLGKPQIKKVDLIDKSYDINKIFSISEAIERNSLHPLAKAIVATAREKKVDFKKASNVKETIGVGITAEIDGEHYILSKIQNYDRMAIQLKHNDRQIAVFEFEDQIKKESKNTIQKLKGLGLTISIFTGDKRKAAEDTIKQLGEVIKIKAEMKPEDKKNGIEELKKIGKITAMVGDGINDAQALALADVGMVFSNEERTAASEAADVVFLGGDFSSVTDAIFIAKKTIHIALQSILFGIGISTIGMVLAAFGFISPIKGAFIQESIDVLVILNALRASK